MAMSGLCMMIVLVVIASLISPASGEIVLIEIPRSVNAVHGSSIVFSCAVIAEDIQFVVNQTLANTQIIVDKGFVQSGVSVINGSTLTRTLMVTASIIYNNTDITCQGDNVPPGPIESLTSDPPALLLVQGPLTSVYDLAYLFIDSSTVNISWSPPFTLPGTDITGYSISATSNGTTTNYFTSINYYELSLTHIIDSPCNEIIITVSGYNGFDGENITLTGIYLPSPVLIDEGALDVLPLSLTEVEDSVRLSSISINVSGICYGQYPTHINLTIQYSNNGSLLTTIDNIPLVSTTNATDILTTTNNTILLLPVDNNYTAIISFSNLGGLFDFNSTIAFDTNVIHGVQDIILSDTIAPTIVLECVFSYNNTVPVVPVVGCLIELVLVEDESISFIETGNKTDDDKAVVKIKTVLPGSYSVRVYDIYSNNDQSSLIAYKINELIILPQQSSTISSDSLIIITNYDGTVSTSSSYSSTKEQLLTFTGGVLISVSPSISFSDTSVNSTRSIITTSSNTVVVVASVGCIVIITVIIISCILVLLYRKHKGSKFSTNNNSSGAPDIVPVVPNPAYQDPRDIISQRNKNSNIIIDTNPSYSHVVRMKAVSIK